MAVGGQLINRWMALSGLLLAICFIFAISLASPSAEPVRAAGAAGQSLGVMTCAGSTCHGRMEGDGRIVRQDELSRWQEPSSQSGAHSRAYSVLMGQRGQQIAATLGLGDATSAPACLGCHADPAPGGRGPKFQISEGVGCEACHGGAQNWIASHYTVGASHAANVAKGMTPLENPVARASVCLDCHFGSNRPGQFVTHRIMAAGHPRISFELDLFSTLQQHWAEDDDYTQRKGKTVSVRLWAVGQAMAVNRQLSLFTQPGIGSEGMFPEFYFFDCHSCHRRIYDQAERNKTWEANPGRPIPAGMPPFNDENMILLSAVAKIASPGMAARFDADSRSFHAAIARDRGSAVAAANKLAASASALAQAFAKAPLGDDTAFSVIDMVSSAAIAPRFTDYEGSVQAVMSVDTLLNALVRSGRVTVGAAAGIRANINLAYGAVKDPNAYRPADFRASLGAAARSVRALR